MLRELAQTIHNPPTACRRPRSRRMNVRRLFAYRILVMRTVVYVDGFNLYYRALRKTKHKWLNLQALCEASLPKSCDIAAINYYTSRVSGSRNPTSPKD